MARNFKELQAEMSEERRMASEKKALTLSYSQQWLLQFATELGIDYDTLMDHAEAWLNDGDYWSEGGRFEGYYIPEAFWEHYKVVMGREGNGNFFTCSC